MPKETVLKIRYNRHIKQHSVNTQCSSVLKPIFTGLVWIFFTRLRANHSSSVFTSALVYILDIALAVYIFPTFSLGIFQVCKSCSLGFVGDTGTQSHHKTCQLFFSFIHSDVLLSSSTLGYSVTPLVVPGKKQTRN